MNDIMITYQVLPQLCGVIAFFLVCIAGVHLYLFVRGRFDSPNSWMRFVGAIAISLRGGGAILFGMVLVISILWLGTAHLLQ